MAVNNEYDNERFFEEYAKMSRSREGLGAAGEWHQLKPLFPPLQEKPFWIWGAAMAGIVPLRHNRGRYEYWGLT